tara:strand:- start:15 stop:293 length:279 start_codon:yes stop_codon:yes gene_type:complete
MNNYPTQRNIKKQATKILHDIGIAYETGVFDDPQTAALYCNLLALVCEGKVEGVFSEDKQRVQWSLSAEFQQEMATLLEEEASSPNVLRGPW